MPWSDKAVAAERAAREAAHQAWQERSARILADREAKQAAADAKAWKAAREAAKAARRGH